MIYKKKTLLTTLTLSSALLLAGCGDSDEVSPPANNDTPAENTSGSSDNSSNSNSSGTDSSGETFGFTDLSIDADYPELDDAIDISYDEDRDQIEAEYKNRFKELDVEGDKAMDEMEPALQKLDLTADTADDEVISKIVEAFELEDGYTSLEVEIQYADGTEKEYNSLGN